MSRFDAIIIGGGHNGLVCAAYLARAGHKVCVLERRHVLGGCATTEAIWPGYKVSTAAYVISLFLPQIIRELKLKEYGLTVLPRVRPPSRHCRTVAACCLVRTAISASLKFQNSARPMPPPTRATTHFWSESLPCWNPSSVSRRPIRCRFRKLAQHRSQQTTPRRQETPVALSRNARLRRRVATNR